MKKLTNNDKQKGRVLYQNHRSLYCIVFPSVASSPIYNRMSMICLQDHLQQKRFIAQNQNNTTYVYDFPEVFRQALYGVWQACGKADTINPADILYTTELVLNSDKELIQQIRLPGENLVCSMADGLSSLYKVTRSYYKISCLFVCFDTIKLNWFDKWVS